MKLCYLWYKKSTFIKNQEASVLLSKLGIRIRLSNISLIGDTLFQGTSCFVLIIFEMTSLKRIKLLTFFC